MCNVVGACFGINEWIYCKLESDGYPYACCKYLFEKGVYPWRDDGTNSWHLSTAAGNMLCYVNDGEIGPAQAFSCLVDVNGNVYWRAALDNSWFENGN